MSSFFAQLVVRVARRLWLLLHDLAGDLVEDRGRARDEEEDDELARYDDVLRG